MSCLDAVPPRRRSPRRRPWPAVEFALFAVSLAACLAVTAGVFN